MRLSPTTANALRVVTVANMVLLSVIGVMLAIWMERPAGFIFGALCLGSVIGLSFVMPLLDPYRNDPGWDPTDT